jgi:hypothetical protein
MLITASFCPVHRAPDAPDEVPPMTDNQRPATEPTIPEPATADRPVQVHEHAHAHDPHAPAAHRTEEREDPPGDATTGPDGAVATAGLSSLPEGEPRE